MGFRKHTFPIRLIDKAEKPIKIVSGWVNDDYTIGFHKICTKRQGWTKWAATDLYSGTCITIQKTRRECVEWIENNKELIEKTMNEPWYIQRVMEFKKLLEKEMEEME